MLATKGNIIVAGEITSRHEPSVPAIVRKVLEDVGYSPDGIRVEVLLHRAGDQGIMVGYACSDTPQFMPMPAVLAQRIVRELSACRISSYIRGSLPDGKAQVTVEYENGIPVRVESVVVSCQHKEETALKKLGAGDPGEGAASGAAPPVAGRGHQGIHQSIRRFVCGGMDADTGLTGRKPPMAKAAGITEQLKATNQMKWVGLMNTVKAQVEEIIFAELIYS